MLSWYSRGSSAFSLSREVIAGCVWIGEKKVRSAKTTYLFLGYMLPSNIKFTWYGDFAINCRKWSVQHLFSQGSFVPIQCLSLWWTLAALLRPNSPIYFSIQLTLVGHRKRIVCSRNGTQNLSGKILPRDHLKHLAVLKRGAALLATFFLIKVLKSINLQQTNSSVWKWKLIFKKLSFPDSSQKGSFKLSFFSGRNFTPETFEKLREPNCLSMKKETMTTPTTTMSETTTSTTETLMLPGRRQL